jgi:hypothetical protein
MASEIGGSDVAHVALVGNDFYRLCGLICFAKLLGYKYDVPRLQPLVDYNNPQKDGMLEGLIALVLELRTRSRDI